MNNFVFSVSVILAVFSTAASCGEFTYADVSKRNAASAFNADVVAKSKMQGECLVGLKELNFKKKNTFDPVAEWTSYRSSSLLQRYSPCEVLIIMEVAQSKLSNQ